MKNKILSVILSLLLIAQIISIPAFALTPGVDYGLIVNSSGETNNCWKAWNQYAQVSAGESSVVLKDTDDTNYASMLYEIPAENQIEFAPDSTVVIEAVLNPDVTLASGKPYGSYIVLRHNIPSTPADVEDYSSKSGDSYNLQGYQQTLGGFCKNYFLGISGEWSSETASRRIL